MSSTRKLLTELLACGLLLGGLAACSSKVTFGINRGRVDRSRMSIDSAIDDEARRQGLRSVIDSYEREVLEIEREVIAIRQEIVAANADYDTTREELEALYGRINGLVARLGESMKTHSLEARKYCSEEEWREIMAHGTSAFNFHF